MGYVSNEYSIDTPCLQRDCLDEIKFLVVTLQYQTSVVGGNFNMIKSPIEKKGGIQRLDPKSKEFGNLIKHFTLIDGPTKNGLFT